MRSPGQPFDLRPVRFDTPLADVDGAVVVESEDQTLTVIETLDRPGGTCTLRLSHHAVADPSFVRDVPLTRELGDVAVLHVRSRPVRAFSLPEGRMQTQHRLHVGLARALFALVCIGGITVIVISGLSPAAKTFLSVALLTVAGLGLLYRPRAVPASRHVFRTGSSTHALEDLLDDRPAATAAVELVDTVKESYGALLSDIVHRIEYPALFDPAVETTRRLTAALIRWDTQQDRMDGAELGTLAAEVRVAFEAARAHAEAVGMDHIPEHSRADARRALKAARLARDSTHPHERRTALAQAQKILAGLAIYYLPTPDEAQLMLEGRRVLALPGRRRSHQPVSETGQDGAQA